MYAIISDSGRQFKVAEGQELDLDYRDVSKGDELTLDKVLAISDTDEPKFGAPLVDGASVTAEVVGVKLGEKLVVQKFRRRKTYRKKTGHRQMYTRVRISKISL